MTLIEKAHEHDQQFEGRCAAGLAQRFFTWMHVQGEAGEYDAVVAPYKRKLLGDLSGTVLEIGAGTGENFPFYPAGIHWIGMEPNFYMQEHLLKTRRNTGSTANSRRESPKSCPSRTRVSMRWSARW